jgi:PTS system nitrogen regulatory IIA component
MKSLLTALEDGRLIELPEGTKDDSLEYLALLVEAVPSVGPGLDIVAAVEAREKEATSALGNGVAVPHARTPKDGELLSAVGWSPAGIDYGAPDGKKVHLVIMYLIPDTRRNTYLKEISGLAKAIEATGGIEDIVNAPDLSTVRHKLLDWVGIALDAALPEVRARMIKLETKQAAVAQALGAAEAQKAGAGLKLVPFSVVKLEGKAPIVLSQDQDLVEALEKVPGLAEILNRTGDATAGGYRILVRSAAGFAAGRQLIECLAIKLP